MDYHLHAVHPLNHVSKRCGKEDVQAHCKEQDVPAGFLVVLGLLQELAIEAGVFHLGADFARGCLG